MAAADAGPRADAPRPAHARSPGTPLAQLQLREVASSFLHQIRSNRLASPTAAAAWHGQDGLHHAAHHHAASILDPAPTVSGLLGGGGGYGTHHHLSASPLAGRGYGVGRAVAAAPPPPASRAMWVPLDQGAGGGGAAGAMWEGFEGLTKTADELLFPTQAAGARAGAVPAAPATSDRALASSTMLVRAPGVGGRGVRAALSLAQRRDPRLLRENAGCRGIKVHCAHLCTR